MVEVSIVYDSFLYPNFDRILEKEAEKFNAVNISAGVGFGQRDIQFEVENFEISEEFAKVISLMEDVDGVYISKTVKEKEFTEEDLEN